MSQASLQIQELSPIHKQMCMYAAMGFKNYEIAEIMNYSESRISIVLNHPDAEAMIARMTTDLINKTTDDVALRIRGATLEAQTKVLELMRSAKSESIQKECAFDILNRGGFKPREVHVNASVELPREEAELIRETLNEMGREILYRPPVDNAVELLTKGSEDKLEREEENVESAIK